MGIRLRLLRMLLLTAALAHTPATGLTAELPPPGSYQIIDGKVDAGTYSGWLIYHTACFVCHGRDGLGTDVAPNLVAAVGRMTSRAFTVKVLTRYRIAVPALDTSADETATIVTEVLKGRRGGAGTVTMPAWQSNPGVEPHVLDIYAYLRARADGALGPGQPKLMGDQPR